MENNTENPSLNPSVVTGGQSPAAQVSAQALKIDDMADAEVTRVTEYGAFVKLPNGKRGLIHISQVADAYVKNVSDHLKVGDKVKARVTAIASDGKIDLTLKTRKDLPASRAPHNANPGGGRFRDNFRQSGGGRAREGAPSSFSSENNKPFKTSVFEEKLKNFLMESEDLQAGLKKHTEEKQGK